MDFSFTDEQLELRAVLRSFLAARSTEADVRRVMESASGIDSEVWKALATELGLAAIAVPEEHGGLGLGFAEVGIALEEFGASLACVPFLSTAVLAVYGLLLAGNEEASQSWLPRIADGTALATIAIGEGRDTWEPGPNTSVVATGTGDERQLFGEKTFVLDGATADLILVSARDGEQLGLFAVEAGAAGLTVTPDSTMDLTRRFATVTMDGVPARVLKSDAAEALTRLQAIALTALAAEQVGGAQRCLDMAVEYARMRFQFGRPIGSFQAIKHKCADNLVGVEAARAASGYALWSAAHDQDSDFVRSARMAKAVASDVFFQTAGDNIQIHGGIGFTWEHPAHLYFKRAKSSELWLGDAIRQRDRIGDLVGISR